MLRLEGVEFARGGFRLAADISVPSGITAVIGPSGGGKSTLLSLIAGFEVPDRGRVLWDRRDLGPLAPGARLVAVLFQDNNLFPHLDVLANVALGLAPRTRPTSEDVSRARAALERVGLTGFEDRRPGALSGGQQSRAALARVLLTDRPVVLMDEAFSALGPALRGEMLDLVRDLLPDATILMVTHDPDDALRVAQQVIFVEEGRVAPPVPTKAFFDAPSEAVRRYLE
ncbi:ATP-binding cassette domain-containing protein [Silicimonas algicola]|uniref:Thiamine transport system ATP-binding protein n=1 Tax=Silicimonas algicola TaxID=1826607 RepID=A0A316G1L6_9RHOB|nr:ATP-binding cassette domain-containing protein [Silicimonas algicola]AZQ65780.1 ATP-binding cassette domain-containing protein [Silicimonas algicola]PWK54844.1 thiamine transport system ATP-binding protein [Silicimonas algicola]